MTVFHNSKSANIFNFLAMNRLLANLSEPPKPEILNLSYQSFISFFEKLNKLDVQYMAIGNFALAYHGLIYTSKSIEIWIASDKENRNKIESVMQPGLINDDVMEGITNDLDENFRLEAHLSLDYYTSGKFNWCYVKSEEAILSDISIPILSLDDLIVEKTASNKPEDKMIVDALEDMAW